MTWRMGWRRKVQEQDFSQTKREIYGDTKRKRIQGLGGGTNEANILEGNRHLSCGRWPERWTVVAKLQERKSIFYERGAGWACAPRVVRWPVQTTTTAVPRSPKKKPTTRTASMDDNRFSSAITKQPTTCFPRGPAFRRDTKGRSTSTKERCQKSRNPPGAGGAPPPEPRGRNSMENENARELSPRG